MGELQIIVFKVGNESYGIDVSYIKGIEKMLSIVRVPTVVPHVLGIINLRGKVIPVLSLKSKFNADVDRGVTDSTRFLIVSYDDMDVALFVDEVSEIENVSEESYFETPVLIKSSETDYVKAIINNGKSLIILLDYTKLLSTDSREQIKEIIKEK